MTKRNCLFLLAILVLAGCGRGSTVPQKAPRPVSVLTLAESDPGRFERVTGVVTSWKTDELGFEVEGRVQFVIEAERDILGQVYDADSRPLTEGTLLARIDPTRYELSVESARAAVAVAEKQREAAQIEYERVIPAEIDAATAERDLARIEVDRQTKLVAENAAAVRALDLAQSRLQQSEAGLAQLAATTEAKASEVASIEARIRELREAEKQALRDLEDCQLYSKFAGQVANVHVVPGSIVRRGEPVVTVQMMDPIKVEFEVSAATVRRLNHRDHVNVHIPQPDGGTLQRLTFIYMVDPVADPRTRTFTVTLMMRNEQVQPQLPQQLKDEPVARAAQVGKLLKDLPSLVQGLFIDENMLQEDDQGFFVWKITNRRVETFSSGDRILNVQKVRVTPGDFRASFLGLANLRDITIADGADFDPDVDMIAGKITPPAGEEAWEGDTLFFDSRRWLLRPGDLVGVDQSGNEIQPGIYVPLDAIREHSGSHAVFAIAASPDGDVAREVGVSVHDHVGTLRRIESTGEEPLAPGTRIVAAGSAFLTDGEPVNVARQVELGR